MPAPGPAWTGATLPAASAEGIATGARTATGEGIVTPGDGNAYLGDGLAQELSARLGRINGLRVASSTSPLNAYWQALCVATALACGLLIGIERGFDLRGLRAHTRVAGVRTFTLVGLASGLAGLAGHSASHSPPARSSRARRRPGDRLRQPAGHQAQARCDDARRCADHRRARLHRWFGQPGFAIAGAAVVTLMLALKAELHGFLDKLDEDDVKALARYAVIAGAVLPFLPNGHYGPLGAWNPQKLWLVVVLVTGFSFLGYVANRIFGERHGTIATALIGGAYSSTAVTQSLAQRLGSYRSLAPKMLGSR